MKFLNLLALLPAVVLALPEGLAESAIDAVARDTIQDLTPVLEARAEAAATVCGSGYKLRGATPLPKGTDPNMRLGNLFAYTKGNKGCVMLDNNTGPNQYMYLRACSLKDKCDKDSGKFSEYAGPVYTPESVCSEVIAKMGKSSSNLYIDYKSEYVFACN